MKCEILTKKNVYVFVLMDTNVTFCPFTTLKVYFSGKYTSAETHYSGNQ